ncbi:MAG: hypothetical protein ACJA0S_001180 [Rickettsiales bacterium]
MVIVLPTHFEKEPIIKMKLREKLIVIIGIREGCPI